MKRFNLACVISLAAVSMLLAGCPDGDDAGGGGGGGSSLPGLTQFRWITQGGSALAGGDTNGGNAGDVSFSADDDILLDARAAAHLPAATRMAATRVTSASAPMTTSCLTTDAIAQRSARTF